MPDKGPSRSTLKHKGSPNLGPDQSTWVLIVPPPPQLTPLGSEPQPPSLTLHTRNLSTNTDFELQCRLVSMWWYTTKFGTIPNWSIRVVADEAKEKFFRNFCFRSQKFN
jgi:hypothetical protein